MDGTYEIMLGGESGFSGLAGDRRGDHRGRMAVSRIVLHDEHRTGAPLFTSHHRRKIRVKDISPLD